MPSKKTQEEMLEAIERAGLAAMEAVKRKESRRASSRKMRERMRLEPQPSVWPSEASQPCSPTRQILRIQAHRKRRAKYREVSKEDWERYER